MVRLMIFSLVIFATMGCNSAQWLTGRLEPITQISVNPFTKSFVFKDTKNNNVVIRGLEINKSTGAFKVAEVIIENNSSAVIAADSERMQHIIRAQEVYVDLHRQIGANIAMALAAGGDAAGNFISKLPNLSLGIDTPIGSGTLGVTQPPKPVEAVEAVEAVEVPGAAIDPPEDG